MSGRKQLLASLGLAVGLAGVFGIAWTMTHRPADYDTVEVELGGSAFRLRVADTEPAREKGLGETTRLPNDHGMLFIYESPQQLCFWMKGMQYPLDMIWLNEGKQITHIEHNIDPATYPKQFCPRVPARYVIELNAGQAAEAKLRIGQQLDF